MKKNLLMMAAAFIFGASVFTSCTSNDDNPASQPDLNLSEKIIGKWMLEELDGQPCPTDMKTVITFVTPTLAYGSISDVLSEAWADFVVADVDIQGNKVSFNAEDDLFSHVADVTVSSITDKDIQLTSDWTVFADGEQIHYEAHGQERWMRVTEDYEDEIIGTWEGKVTNTEDKNTDGELHRWEYRADGTYVYYHEGGAEWVPSDDVLSEYFVDGVLLCTRWKHSSDSEELREWWEIESIENGVMKWKALRMREDGTTYTATFEMKKVK